MKNKIRYRKYVVWLSLGIMTSFLLLGLASCKESKKVSKDEGYYTCAMHPQVIEQEPGPCPICGMRMTYISTSKKKKKHDHSKMNMSSSGDSSEMSQPQGFTFSLGDTLLANSKLLTYPAKFEKFTREAKYSAHIDYNEDANSLVIINTKYDGWVERLYVSKEGQYVSRGKVLMGIYSPVILAAKEEYVTTYMTIKSLYSDQGKSADEVKNDATVRAARNKLSYLDVPASQIAKLESAGKAGRLSYYFSPIGGVVVKKEVLQGAFIKAGQELIRIASMGKLWGFIHVFEKDLQFIKKGQRVNLVASAYPDKVFKGRIDLIYPFLDPQTRDIKVRIIIHNPGLKLKPGMFADVVLKTTLAKKHIIIPDTAIIYSGDKVYTFVSLGDGEFETRAIKIKTTSAGKAIVAEGLKENDLVVINGQFLLDSEASLKEAISKGGMVGHNH